MNDAALHRFAKQLRLDAETKALPEKVRILRNGIGKATGHADGAALAASPEATARRSTQPRGGTAAADRPASTLTPRRPPTTPSASVPAGVQPARWARRRAAAVCRP